MLLCLLIIFIANFAIYSRGQGTTKDPIWLWGLPSWYGGGEITAEMISDANEWAYDKFGATFRLTSIPEGVSRVIRPSEFGEIFDFLDTHLKE